MTSRFSTPPGQIPLEKGSSGYHLPSKVAKSWKTLEQTCRQISNILQAKFRQDRPKVFLRCLEPPKPSEFGYFEAHPSEEMARSALYESLDAFVILFAHVSFYIAICRLEIDPLSISSSTSRSDMPEWFRILSERKNRLSPEWLQLLADSPISDFTTTPQRLGTIVNVARCSWVHLLPCMMSSNVPIWLYWGVPPAFGQPLHDGALRFAPRSHLQSRAPPLLGVPPSQPVGPSVPRRHAGSGQPPGETWREFLTRQNQRRRARLEKENKDQRMVREGREMTAAKKQCPGKRGPTVYIWEEDNGIWTRTLLSRGEVEDHWWQFSSSQKLFNSVDNCWDLCLKFDEGTAGGLEQDYDPNNSENEMVIDSTTQSAPTSVQDASDWPPMVVDPTTQSVPTPVEDTSNFPTMVVDPTPHSVSTAVQVTSDNPFMAVDPTHVPVSTPTQVAPDCPPILVAPPCAPAPDQVAACDLLHPNSQSRGDGDEDLYHASMQDVINAYSFVTLGLEQMPITTLNDLLYYRYGFSLSEQPYIPTSVYTQSFRSWIEVCRAVGGQQLGSSAVNRGAIEDFLSILAGSTNPFTDVPGKYWDLNPSNHKSIVDLARVFISIEERQFADGKKYIIHPRFLHPTRDAPWCLCVDPMTALECVRRGLGPHTVNITNFLITHGVHFHALQRITPPENPHVRQQCRYLGYRSADYHFDLADFAGYEALRDSFLRSQPNGPLALREGGIIARLAREVLPNSNALSGPSSEALKGHHARFVCDDGIYVDDD